MSTDHERDRTDRLVARGIDRLIGIGDKKRATEALNKGRSELKPETLERLEVALGLRRAAMGRVMTQPPRPQAVPPPPPLAAALPTPPSLPAVEGAPSSEEHKEPTAKRVQPVHGTPPMFGTSSEKNHMLPKGVTQRQMRLLNGFSGVDLLKSAVEYHQATGCNDFQEIERELTPVLTAMKLKVRRFGSSYAIVPLDRP